MRVLIDNIKINYDEKANQNWLPMRSIEVDYRVLIEEGSLSGNMEIKCTEINKCSHDMWNMPELHKYIHLKIMSSM